MGHFPARVLSGSAIVVILAAGEARRTSVADRAVALVFWGLQDKLQSQLKEILMFGHHVSVTSSYCYSSSVAHAVRSRGQRAGDDRFFVVPRVEGPDQPNRRVSVVLQNVSQERLTDVVLQPIYFLGLMYKRSRTHFFTSVGAGPTRAPRGRARGKEAGFASEGTIHAESLKRYHILFSSPFLVACFLE